MTIIAIITIIIVLVAVLALFEVVPMILDQADTHSRVELLAVQMQEIEDQAVAYLERQRHLHSLIK